MEARSFIQRVLLGAFGTLLGVGLLAAVGRASEIAAQDQANGLVIHGPEETLRSFCRMDPNQVLWLELPGGTRFELVTSTGDPAILNPGDGSFHSFDEAEVRAALSALRFPLDGVSGEIFLLPYPRRAGLESAAGPGLILLAPGVRPLSAEHQHAELVHEMGHLVQYRLMPDAATSAWTDYRRLRGIEDADLYNAASAHPDRPHEIFAEDFRVLYGDPLANYSGTIENESLTPPAQVAGLRAFLDRLAGGSALKSTLIASPNPARGPVVFSRGAGAAAPLDLFDVTGRRIATVAPLASALGVRWVWDGRTSSGRATAPGTLFARVRGEAASATRIAVAP